MNSEIPPNRESDNSDLELERSQVQSDQPSTEVTSKSSAEFDVDMWDDDTLATFEPSSAIEPEESEAEPLEISTSEEMPLEDPQDNNNQTEADLPSQPASEPELFVDSWLDEPENPSSSELNESHSTTVDETADLEQQKASLHQEIEQLKAQKEQLLLQQIREVQENMGRMVEEGTKELKERKMALQIEIEKLERRKQRINQEMRSNFAGSSQELAVRVQGFKDYLVGSLQDLATAAEKLELIRQQESAPRRREAARSSENPRREERRGRRREESSRARNSDRTSSTQFSEPTFAEQSRRIRQLIDKYRNNPDYYGAPWQLRRTFEVAQAKTVQEWFFVQGGRGAVDSMGSRLQNILVASAVISILHSLYGDRCRVLVLTDTPENLGEWRRGLQDCLGISRSSFGTNRGVVLFDSPDVLVQRAERLLADKLLPIIVVDETEELLNLAILKFPLWLAFAATNKSTSSNYLY